MGRLHARRLFKTYELFGEQATPRGRLDALDIAREVAVPDTSGPVDLKVRLGERE